MKKTKRMLIYFFNGKNGIVDEYSIYLISQLNKYISEIVFLTGIELHKDSKEKLSHFSYKVVETEKDKYSAIKEYICSINEKQDFQDIIIMDDSIMGPINDFSSMIHAIETQDADVWSIWDHYQMDENKIQENVLLDDSCFMLSNDIIKSVFFRDWLYNNKDLNGFIQDSQCTYNVWISTRKLYEFSYRPLIFCAKELVKNFGCPVFKIEIFVSNYADILNNSLGENGYEFYKYVNEETNFNTNLIWSHILRCYNMADIKRNMQLNYIVSSKNSKDVKTILKQRKIALFIHIYYEDLIEYCFHYAQSMPIEADIYITTDTEKKQRKIDIIFSKLSQYKVKTILIKNRGRDVGALLVGLRNFVNKYDFICFLHDKKVEKMKPQSKGYGFSYKCYENMIGNRNVVNNIIALFEENPRLGLLTAPPPNHSDYYKVVGAEWTSNFNNTFKLAQRLGLTVDIDMEKEPVAPLGSIFWFRAEAMNSLYSYNWDYKDFPQEPSESDGTLLHAIERIHGYVAQDAGYYVAWGLSDSGAAIEITNLNYMVSQINRVMQNKGGIINLSSIISDILDMIKKYTEFNTLKKYTVQLEQEIGAVKNELYKANDYGVNLLQECKNLRKELEKASAYSNELLKEQDNLRTELEKASAYSNELLKEQDNLRTELEKASDFINMLEVEKNSMQLELNKAEEYVHLLENNITETNQQISLMEKDIVKASKYAEQLNDNIQMLKDEVTEKKNIIENMKQDIENLESRNNELEKELDMVYQSNSWKMTEFYRKMGDFIKKEK